VKISVFVVDTPQIDGAARYQDCAGRSVDPIRKSIKGLRVGGPRSRDCLGLERLRGKMGKTYSAKRPETAMLQIVILSTALSLGQAADASPMTSGGNTCTFGSLVGQVCSLPSGCPDRLQTCPTWKAGPGTPSAPTAVSSPTVHAPDRLPLLHGRGLVQ
jgi:hypothetical protein